jgi:hypothetical protein
LVSPGISDGRFVHVITIPTASPPSLDETYSIPAGSRSSTLYVPEGTLPSLVTRTSYVEICAAIAVVPANARQTKRLTSSHRSRGDSLLYQ